MPIMLFFAMYFRGSAANMFPPPSAMIMDGNFPVIDYITSSEIPAAMGIWLECWHSPA